MDILFIKRISKDSNDLRREVGRSKMRKLSEDSARRFAAAGEVRLGPILRLNLLCILP